MTANTFVMAICLSPFSHIHFRRSAAILHDKLICACPGFLQLVCMVKSIA
jgi:hypothetical protein